MGFDFRRPTARGEISIGTRNLPSSSLILGAYLLISLSGEAMPQAGHFGNAFSSFAENECRMTDKEYERYQAMDAYSAATPNDHSSAIHITCRAVTPQKESGETVEDRTGFSAWHFSLVQSLCPPAKRKRFSKQSQNVLYVLVGTLSEV